MEKLLFDLKMKILNSVIENEDLKLELAEDILEIEQQVAINNIHCCKSDSDLLRDKKIKDLINLAKSELSNYNKQKFLKIETEDCRRKTKLLKNIIDLQNF